MLSWPANWTRQVQEGKENVPPTIEFSDPGGGVKLLITPLWSPTPDPQFNSPEKIRAAIERAAQAAQETALEKELPLQEITAKSGRGYYFAATDRAPKKGEYEYMANGAVPAGELLVSFTILSHTAPPKGLALPLAVVRTSRQISTSW